MQISVFILDMIIDLPNSWNNVIAKLILILWSIAYPIYWLSALRFPTKFIYFLPVILIFLNLMMMLQYINSIIEDLGEMSPEDTIR